MLLGFRMVFSPEIRIGPRVYDHDDDDDDDHDVDG